ncbi:MAG: ankyrin repeat domain-containing protein [Pseudomonas sp.]|uniref:ankyrin repeat domain-containing protein n=1 Tax=Pseudomonas sp. TaxID=306 RepID=UPI00391B1EE5
MTSLEKTYGQNAPLVRDIYAHIETGDVNFLRTQLGIHPQLLEPPRFGLVSYPGLLHHAAENNQLAVCQLLVELGIDIDQATVGSGNSTPLAAAAKNGHLEVIRWLIEAGAEVDGSPLSVASPLITAVTFGQTEAVDLLLSLQADINRLHAKFNRTALDLARSWNFSKIAERLEVQGAVSAVEKAADEVSIPGAPIVDFVSETAGWVLPEKVTPQPQSADVKFRVSCIADKNDYKLLFTLGLFTQNPRTELFICLPGNWRLPRQGFAIDSPWMFPQGILCELSKQTMEKAPLSEGQLILRSEPAFSSLGWPADIDALIVVDKIWTINAETDHHNDSVKLFVLVPLKLPKKGPPEGDAMKTLLEKKRKASWKSIALNSPLHS